MSDLPVGSVFAGHVIEGVAGRGGMGVVYRAKNVILEQDRALKVIKPEFSRDEKFRERFKRESRLAASLDHPNVIPVHHAGDEAGILFITMRLVDGTDLGKAIVGQRRLSPAHAIHIVRQVASALDAAHRLGLVHRDVKPANVLLSGEAGNEHAYLTDFGLTKLATSDSGLTGTGLFVGTIDYIAPEQMEGGPLDSRADVYSLGCVLYHTLTGSVPYPGDTQLAKMWAHANAEPPSVVAQVPGLPRRFDDIIRRALAKRPTDRYPSAGELAEAASDAISEASSPKTPPPSQQLTKPELVPQQSPPPSAAAAAPVPAPAIQRLAPKQMPPAPAAHPPQPQPQAQAPVDARIASREPGVATVAWGPRAGAAAIDFVSQFFVAMVPALLLMALVDPSAFNDGEEASDAGALAFLAGYFLTVLVFQPLFMRRSGKHNGQSLGHQAVRIRAHRLDGKQMDFGKAVLRDGLMKWCVFYGIAAIFVVPALLDALWPLWDNRDQALHDKVAETIVTRA